MSGHDTMSRREFCGAAAAVAAGLTLPPLAWPEEKPAEAAVDLEIPAWVRGVRSMAFGSAADLDDMAAAGVQVLHTNMVWPYYPLRRDGGGLAAEDAAKLKELVTACRPHGIRLSLGLPPFPPVSLVREHPDWRVHEDEAGSILNVTPEEGNLGTRVGCNLGPWGDYLIEVCGELTEDFGLDGFSFDGNYHPPVCHCSACRSAYLADRRRAVPPKVDLEDVAYREYLVWRGERLEDHYRRLKWRLRKANPDAAVMTWTVNAGRFGHLLFSPRAMPTRMNRLIDLPMQEWWLDETNLGASVAPAFGAAYLHATTGGNPCASEPYLMSRGNPYGTYSFPRHERLARTLLALTHGNVSAQSFGWPGHRESAKESCREVNRRAEWTKGAEPLRWAAMLVSEQTRQFYAFRDIRELFLPHVYGAFRAALEEHLPLRLINDWDISDEGLKAYGVLLLPNAAALSDAQAEAIRRFVRSGGGIVATGETSLWDELGRPRRDFALADLFGVSFRGRPSPTSMPVPLDENFARSLDASYWKERVGVATLTWQDQPLLNDAKLEELVPTKSVIFRGPQVLVSEPADPGEVAVRLQPDGATLPPSPAGIVRSFGKGKVAYFAASLDAALWSYSFPYQRRLLARAIKWAASEPPPVRVEAPMCVQAASYRQAIDGTRRIVVHLFNDLNTAAGHGIPTAEVPLREETVPVGGIRVVFAEPPQRCRFEPDGVDVPLRKQNDGTAVAAVPPVALHGMVVAEV